MQKNSWVNCQSIYKEKFPEKNLKKFTTNLSIKFLKIVFKISNIPEEYVLKGSSEYFQDKLLEQCLEDFLKDILLEFSGKILE